MKTFEEERREYIVRFGMEPPKCHACKGDGYLDQWDHSREIETKTVCEFCDGNGYHTVQTQTALDSAGVKQ